MLKLRLEGLKEDIFKYVEIVRGDESINTLCVSDIYPNRGPISQYYRCYVDIDFVNQETDNKETL